MLVEHDADVNAPGVLIAACEGKALSCMEWLLTHGAQITGSAQESGRTVSWNAFTHAAHFNKQCPGMLALLLEHGAEVDDVHPDEGNTLGSTALHNVARQGDVAGITLLLEHGASTDIVNELGERPVDVAKNKNIRNLLKKSP
jgi:ankyrin repeat protein